MQILKINKKDLNEFILSLRKFGEVHVPVKRGAKQFVFSELTDLSLVELEYNRTILPPKKYFNPPTEALFKFSKDKGYQLFTKELERKYVIFGLHSCDIYALKILDLIFAGKFVDNRYFIRRQNTVIIGLDCIPDEKCFCRSMRTDFVEDGFDLFLSDIGSSYLVRVGTSRGDDMVSNVKKLFKEVSKKDIAEYKKRSDEKKNLFKVDVELSDLPEIMDLEYESKVWDEIGKDCLSCGSCSMVCPTCYCYDVFDEIELDSNRGVRKKQWDSCLFKDYAMVAGGHNFREERSSRVKNRFFHKQRGFVTQYGRPSCVGCGRCIEACPANIDIIEVINRIRGVRL
jgi:sulfhydrogenase subunit beta (sulfur reductase)